MRHPLLTVFLAVVVIACSGVSTPASLASGHIPRWLATLALRQAALNGDKHTTRVTYKMRRTTADITLHGRFVCKTECSFPPGGSAPRGTVMTLTVDLRTHEIEDFGLTQG